MDEQNNVSEEQNIEETTEEVKEQDNSIPESANASESVAKTPAPKAPKNKLPLIIGGIVAGVAAVAVAVALVLGGGNDNETPVHTHSFGEWKTKTPANCINAEVESRTCYCGHEELRNGDTALGHAFGEWTTTEEATCIKDGTKERNCECGEKQIAFISTNAHNYSEWKTEKAASCTEDGSEKRTCICGEFETRVIKATGHTEVIDNGIPANCTTPGLTEGSHCKTCKTIIRSQKEIPINHDAPHGVCLLCSKVIDSDDAAREYVTVSSNAMQYYFSTYYNGSKYVTYDFDYYDLEISIGNTYDGKVYISVFLDITCSLAYTSSLYSGTGFLSYRVETDDYTLKDGFREISSNTLSINWMETMDKIDYINFKLYLDDYYM